jgi:hypothetical protein
VGARAAPESVGITSVRPLTDPEGAVKKLLVLLILVMVGVAVARKLREA